MNLDQITPLILTYNEAPNIQRTLENLTWAKQIVVIDSYSTDETLAILKNFKQVSIFQRQFESFADQCNYGLSKIISEWVLSLDADYLVTNDLIQAIQLLPDQTLVNSFSVQFKYCVFGKTLQGTLLPPRKVLYRGKYARYSNDGHSHKVIVDGLSEQLSGYIYHDDRKPLSRWLWAQDRYMILETQKLINTPISDLSIADKIRKFKILSPFVVFFYCLFLRKGILDGWEGWYYAMQRMLAETLLVIHLIEAEKLSDKPQPLE